jgi:hypothetical protein
VKAKANPTSVLAGKLGSLQPQEHSRAVAWLEGKALRSVSEVSMSIEERDGIRAYRNKSRLYVSINEGRMTCERMKELDISGKSSYLKFSQGFPKQSQRVFSVLTMDDKLADQRIVKHFDPGTYGR